MNNLLSYASLVAFFILPLVVLGVRATRPNLMPWWLAAATVALLGWLFSVGIVEFHFAALGDQLRTYGEHPPEELVRRWASDSGRPFARLFGWAYALIFFVPWLLAYGIYHLGRRLYANYNT